MPTLEKLYRQEPESVPFRYPVDPQALAIPDYFEIVKKPMDLGTIRSNILNGKYSDPWEYVDDVWLMFDNAWLYNRKTSRVYRYCTKVNSQLQKAEMRNDERQSRNKTQETGAISHPQINDFFLIVPVFICFQLKVKPSVNHVFLINRS